MEHQACGDMVICDVLINQIGVEELSNDYTKKFPITQNSVEKSLIIYYDIPDAKKIKADIYDITEIKVGPVFAGKINGKGIIRYEPQNLAKGVYFLKVEQGEEKEVIKFVYLDN